MKSINSSLVLVAVASVFATSVFAADPSVSSKEKTSTNVGAKADIATVISDEKAHNAEDKKAVKKASPQVLKNAEQEAKKAHEKRDQGSTSK